MSTPAGWYQDPQQPMTLRYWDGTMWTEHRQPMQNMPVPPAGTPGTGNGVPSTPWSTQSTHPTMPGSMPGSMPGGMSQQWGTPGMHIAPNGTADMPRPVTAAVLGWLYVLSAVISVLIGVGLFFGAEDIAQSGDIEVDAGVLSIAGVIVFVIAALQAVLAYKLFRGSKAAWTTSVVFSALGSIGFLTNPTTGILSIVTLVLALLPVTRAWYSRPRR